MSPVDPHFLSEDEEFQRGHDRTCLYCDYNLRGLPSGAVCPECGEIEGDDADSEAESDASLAHIYRGGTLVDRDFQPEPGSARPPRDVPAPPKCCLSCGYALTGHGSIGRCPECGLAYDHARERAAAAAKIMPGGITSSSRWMLGLVLALAGVVGVGFIGILAMTGRFNMAGFAICMSLASGLWAASCWSMLPSTLDSGSPTWRSFRVGACVSQVLWPASFLLQWSIVSGSSTPGFAASIIGVFDFLAFCGFAVILILVHRIASDLYLRETARWLMNAIWIQIILGLFMLAIAGPMSASLGVAAVPGTGMRAISYFLVLPQVVILVILALALLEMLNFNLWARKHNRDLGGRLERVRSKQEAGGGFAGAKPETDRERACDSCGYDLRGLAPGIRCPECGTSEESVRPVIPPQPDPVNEDDIPLA